GAGRRAGPAGQPGAEGRGVRRARRRPRVDRLLPAGRARLRVLLAVPGAGGPPGRGPGHRPGHGRGLSGVGGARSGGRGPTVRLGPIRRGVALNVTHRQYGLRAALATGGPVSPAHAAGKTFGWKSPWHTAGGR